MLDHYALNSLSLLPLTDVTLDREQNNNITRLTKMGMSVWSGTMFDLTSVYTILGQ